MFVEKWLKIIARETGPSSPCKVETFGLFCTKPSSHFHCQGSLQVQRDLLEKGWLMVPSGKWGDSAPCPAGGWDGRARPCADGGTWTHQPMPGSSIHCVPQTEGSSLLGEGRDSPRAPHCGECQGFPEHLYLLQYCFNRTLPLAGGNPWRKVASTVIIAAQGQAGSQRWSCTTKINISSRGFTEAVCHGQRLCRAAKRHTLHKDPGREIMFSHCFPNYFKCQLKRLLRFLFQTEVLTGTARGS